MFRKNLTLLLLTYSAAMCSGEGAASPVDINPQPATTEKPVVAESKPAEVVSPVEATPPIENPKKPYMFSEAEVRTMFEESGLEFENLEVGEKDEDTYTCRASIKIAQTLGTRNATFFVMLNFNQYVGPRITVFLELYRGNPDQSDEDFLQKTTEEYINAFHVLTLRTKKLESKPESFPGDSVLFTASNVLPRNKESAREVLVSFFCLMASDVDELLSQRDGSIPIFVPEREVGENLLLSFDNRFAYELKCRARGGFKIADYAAGRPMADDPLAYPMQMITFWDIQKAVDVEITDNAADLLKKDPLSSLPSRRALDTYIRCQTREPSEQELAELESLALDPVTKEIRDPAANYMYARFKLDKEESLDDSTSEYYVRWASSVRGSAILGFPQALHLYANLLESIDDEDFEPDSVDLLESKEWQALAPILLEIFYGDHKGNLDTLYKKNDFTPIVLTGPRDPEQFKLAQSALVKMNAARQARGWITFALINPEATGAPVEVAEATNASAEVADASSEPAEVAVK
jgi:hypothetical protein